MESEAHALIREASACIAELMTQLDHLQARADETGNEEEISLALRNISMQAQVRSLELIGQVQALRAIQA